MAAPEEESSDGREDALHRLVRRDQELRLEHAPLVDELPEDGGRRREDDLSDVRHLDVGLPGNDSENDDRRRRADRHDDVLQPAPSACLAPAARPACRCRGRLSHPDRPR